MWRFMNNKGWKPFRRQKKPLLTDKQRKARLQFDYKYQKLTAEECKDFIFTDECPKYLFQLPNPKNDVVWVLKKAKSHKHTKRRKEQSESLGWSDRPRLNKPLCSAREHFNS